MPQTNTQIEQAMETMKAAGVELDRLRAENARLKAHVLNASKWFRHRDMCRITVADCGCGLDAWLKTALELAR